MLWFNIRLQISLSFHILDSNSANSYHSMSLKVNVLKCRAICKSVPTKGLPFLIESNDNGTKMEEERSRISVTKYIGKKDRETER